MNSLAVVRISLHFLLRTDAPDWILDVPSLVFAAHHKADLAAGIGRNCGVGIFNNREYFFAGSSKASDQVGVQPYALSYEL